MPDTSTTFDCPVARKSVTYTVSDDLSPSGKPPESRIKACTGLATCGVEERFRGGVSHHWQLCPAHRSLAG